MQQTLNNRHRRKLQSLQIAGLDIGSAAVKMIRLERNSSGLHATGAAWIELDSSDTETQDAALQWALKKSLQQFPESRQALIGALAGTDLIVRNFSFPPLPDEAIAQAVQLEAQQISPFDLDKCVLEYQIIETNKNDPNRQGILIIASHELIQKKAAQIENAGGKTLIMDVEGLAALNCLFECMTTPLENAVALINLGNQYTNIAIQGQNGIPFLRDLSSGGSQLLKTLHTQTQTSITDLKKSMFASQETAGQNTALNESTKKAACRLIHDINETLRYYLTQQPGSQLAKVYLAGGWALSPILVDVLVQSLPAEVKVFDPFKTISIRTPDTQQDLLKNFGPAFTVAAGLAMRKFA